MAMHHREHDKDKWKKLLQVTPMVQKQADSTESNQQ